MQIRWDEEGWYFEQMDSFPAGLLRELPACAVPDDEAARERIFSSPTGGADATADQEWSENVVPDLAALFQSHVDVVIGDLAEMKTEGEASSVHVPVVHARAWIHTLNQARLALGARHGVTDDDTAGRRRTRSRTKAHGLMQIDFYGMLLGLILAHTEI
ncbi:MAG: DUF2017 family protein [Chthoniobacteraceae bacterium]